MKHGRLTKDESLELCEMVLAEDRSMMVEAWLADDKLECSEEIFYD